MEQPREVELLPRQAEAIHRFEIDVVPSDAARPHAANTQQLEAWGKVERVDGAGGRIGAQPVERAAVGLDPDASLVIRQHTIVRRQLFWKWHLVHAKLFTLPLR